MPDCAPLDAHVSRQGAISTCFSPRGGNDGYGHHPRHALGRKCDTPAMGPRYVKDLLERSRYLASFRSLWPHPRVGTRARARRDPYARCGHQSRWPEASTVSPSTGKPVLITLVIRLHQGKPPFACKRHFNGPIDRFPGPRSPHNEQPLVPSLRRRLVSKTAGRDCRSARPMSYTSLK